jgi:hypothetical protein
MYRFGVLVLLIDLRGMSTTALVTAAMSTHGIAALARRGLLQWEKNKIPADFICCVHRLAPFNCSSLFGRRTRRKWPRYRVGGEG